MRRKPTDMKIHLLALLFILASSFAGAQYSPGYYIDSSGNKIPGLLEYDSVGDIFTKTSNGICRLYYKADSSTRKATKFTARDIKGFVIGADSFTVIHDFRYNANTYFPVDFVRVLEIGRIKILQYDPLQKSAMLYVIQDDPHWILEKDHKGHILDHGSWRKTLEALISDDPELLEKIKKDGIKRKEVRQTIRDYNAYMAGAGSNTP